MAAAIPVIDEFKKRTPIEGDFREGDFVVFDDKGNKHYGILRNGLSGKVEWIDFTDSTGRSQELSDFACNFTNIKRVQPNLIGLQVRCKSCPEDEIFGQIVEDENKDLLLNSDQQNDLMDNLEFSGKPYSCLLLNKEERRQMDNATFGRVRSALSFLRNKNFGYRFIAVKGDGK